jgi:hypothetical protein
MSKFDMPMFQSKFLGACADYLVQEHGLNDIVPFAKLRNESFCAAWDSGLGGDFPSFFVEDGGWSFEGRNDDGGGLMMDVFDRGGVVFRSLDGDSVYLKTRIEAPEELGEMMALFMSIKPAHLEAPHWVSLPLSSIVEQVFLVLPRDGRDILVPFDAKLFANQQPELWRAIKVLHGISNDEDITNLNYSCWADWVSKHADWNSLPAPVNPISRDKFFSGDWGLHSWRLHATRETEFFDMGPRFALRINAKQSPMFFHLFTQQTREGAPLLDGLIANLNNPQSWCKHTQVSYPSSIIAQRRLAFEFRVLRQQYDEKHESLVREREPVKQLIELYERRVRLVGLLHTEYSAEIETVQYPLPFLIEWPHRRYQRADDRLLKIKYGQQLLSIMAKLPLFLLLEELRFRTELQTEIAPIEAELFGKPTSDGSVLKYGRELQKLVSNIKLASPWFDNLLEFFKTEGDHRMSKIIEARNRFHHPPHDERGMLTTLDQEIPPLMAMFRKALDGVIFITPESQNYENGQHVVVFRRLMGFEADFPLEKEVTTIPFDGLPSGEVVLVDSRWQRALPLTRLFKRHTIQTLSLDVGVFDRMVHGQPEYVFVRGLGQEVD